MVLGTYFHNSSVYEPSGINRRISGPSWKRSSADRSWDRSIQIAMCMYVNLTTACALFICLTWTQVYTTLSMHNTYVCQLVYVYIYMYRCMYACMYACLSVCLSVCLSICLYVQVCMYACINCVRALHSSTATSGSK